MKIFSKKITLVSFFALVLLFVFILPNDIFAAVPGTPDMVNTTDSYISNTSGTNTDNVTNNNKPSFTVNTGDAYDFVFLYDGSTQIDGMSAGLNKIVTFAPGVYSCSTNYNYTFSEGTHNITAKKASGSNCCTNSCTLSDPSPALTITIDSTAPAKPGTPVLTAGSDTGTVGDNSTFTKTPSFTVTCDPGVNNWVFLYSNGGALGSAPCTSSPVTITASAYSNTATTTYSITAKQADLAGNYSITSDAASVTITSLRVSAGLDQYKSALFTQTATVEDPSGRGINTTSYQWSKVSGTGNINFGSATSLVTTIAATVDGAYVIKFSVKDTGGSTTSATFNLTWDTTAPAGGSISYSQNFVLLDPTIIISYSIGTGSGSNLNNATGKIQRAVATYNGTVCGAFGSFLDLHTGYNDSPYSDTVASGQCYKYQYSISDVAGNTATYTSNNVIQIAPAVGPSNPVLTATAILTAGINLSWTAPYSGGSPITGYKIERCMPTLSDPDCSNPASWPATPLIANTQSTATTYDDINLMPLRLGAANGSTVSWVCRGINSAISPFCTATRGGNNPTVTTKTPEQNLCITNTLTGYPSAGISGITFGWTYHGASTSLTQTSAMLEVYEDSTYSTMAWRYSIIGSSSGITADVKVGPSMLAHELGFGKTYYWQVKVSDENGDSGFVKGESFTTPSHAYPHILITVIPSSPIVKYPFNLDARASTCYGSTGGCTYNWTLDDNTTLTGPITPSIIRNTAKTYIEHLKVTDNDGYYCEADQPVKVKTSQNVPQWKEISPF